jgi:2-polyprenyl-3-methyl-5-hydroxy-6-metoxy-1,4-benzoquinol methylase
MRDTEAFLDAVRQTYTRESLQDKAIRRLAVRTFEPYLSRDGRGMQMGYSEGIDTELLAARVARLEVVEGCRAFIEDGERRGLPNVGFRHAMFEDLALATDEAPFDYVFANYVLEHVLDVPQVLGRVRGVLKPGGLLFVVVPNARALSRQLAVHMGLLPEVKALTEHDHSHGHRRVYDRVSLDRDVEAAGFRIIAQGGLMLKILADFQLNRLFKDGILEEAHIDGLYRLGLEYPDLCGSLFAVCRPEAAE